MIGIISLKNYKNFYLKYSRPFNTNMVEGTEGVNKSELSMHSIEIKAVEDLLSFVRKLEEQNNSLREALQQKIDTAFDIQQDRNRLSQEVDKLKESAAYMNLDNMKKKELMIARLKEAQTALDEVGCWMTGSTKLVPMKIPYQTNAGASGLCRNCSNTGFDMFGALCECRVAKRNK